MVHQRLALDYTPVQRDHTAGAYHNAIVGADVVYLGQHLGAVYLLPHAVDLQAHGTGQIRHRFFVRPVLQKLAQPQHKHNRTGGGKIAPHKGYRDGGGVQHGDRQLTMPQRRNTLADIFDGANHRQRRGYGQRQKQLGNAPPYDSVGQLVLKFPVQRAGGMLRHKPVFLCLGKGKTRQRLNQIPSVGRVHHNGVLCAVKDLDALHTAYSQQVVFQHIGLLQRHSPAAQMHPQPSG